jgi:hypothetical protein
VGSLARTVDDLQAEHGVAGFGLVLMVRGLSISRTPTLSTTRRGCCGRPTDDQAHRQQNGLRHRGGRTGYRMLAVVQPFQ